MIGAGFWESLPEQLRTALIGVCVVALVGIGRILYVWLRRIEQQVGEVKVTSQDTADTAKAVERAVNNQPEGQPTLAEQVAEMREAIQPLAERMELVATEADRKHDENQALVAGVAAELARLEVRVTSRLDTIGWALGMDVEPWDPSKGDRRAGP